MIFEAKFQSFKFLVMMLIFVGSTLVADCQAERTPVSLESQNFCQELLGAEVTHHLETVKQNRERSEQVWSDFKLFASKRVTLAQQKLASLDLTSWWELRSGPVVSPARQQPPVEIAETATISVTAMVVNYAAKMNLLQWLQLSNLTVELSNRGHQRVAESMSSLESDLQASLLQLAKSTSTNIVQLVKSRRVSGMIEAMSVAESPSSTGADSALVIKSTDEDPVADPYWQYYADCDYWGARFEAENE